MAILICRVAWMPGYQSDNEPAKGGGSYVNEGNVPHESRNFLPVGDTYYGYVKNRGKININRLGAQNGDESISGVSVVFCAEEPKSGAFLVIGWYSDATVYREPIERPEQDPLGRQVYFKAAEATPIGKAERCFPIPRVQDRGPFGGVGQRNIWYGLNAAAPRWNAQAETFRQSLFAYMETPSLWRPTSPPVVESRKRWFSEHLKREGEYRPFIRIKGYQCEACEWKIEEEEVAVWGSSFELHHLKPVAELKEGASREVRPKDFAVLCASCHRAIHRADNVHDVNVADVAVFARDYLPAGDVPAPRKSRLTARLRRSLDGPGR